MDREGAPRQAQGRVELLASTGDITADGNESTSPRPGEHAPATSRSERDDGLRDYFESAQWTADGTTLLTSSSSNVISGYIVPEDLLSPAVSRPLKLAAQATIQLPEPSNVLAGAPYFRLAEPWTQQLLVSARDHPIQLFYLDPSRQHQKPASCYPLTKARSETFLSATSLVWPDPGTHFVAGSRNLLAKFDVRRAGDEPLLRVKTIPSDRHLSKGGGVGMRGAVSALAAQPPDARHASLVAAATWTRWVGLYDFAQSSGACVATWSIARAGTDEARVGGDGVAQAAWSPCGRYLLLGERKSAGVLVYDVRVTGKLLGWLAGRDALGNQRIACDVFPGQGGGGAGGEDAGFEVWSGSTHGAVEVWEGVGTREGAHEPSWGWSAAQRSTVASTCMHQSGTVVATCSGSWEFPDELEGDGDDECGSQSESSSSEAPWMRRRNRESSLKIWSISNNSYEAASPGETGNGPE
ncbi:hypothetical protein F4818DRAFT_453936 [Hypoxylon cercidicola]|nr:hypothetical protein F4818DRAFT_453936 [Hypoxylon cercidicola]